LGGSNVHGGSSSGSGGEWTLAMYTAAAVVGNRRQQW